MTLRAVLLFACLMGTTSAVFAQAGEQPAPAAAAQTPRPATAPAAPTPAPAERAAPRREGQPVNIKVDVTITDQRGGAQALKKTVSVVVADSYMGLIRSSSNVVGVNVPVPLNIDAEPLILSDGKIRLRVNVQYDWPGQVPDSGNMNRGTVMKTEVHENFTVVVENGKPLVASQSADPVADRQVIVELKATVLR